MKIYIATPHINDCEAYYAQSLALMPHAMSAQYHIDMFENSLLAEGRTDVFFRAKESGFDYLLLIDTDKVFPVDALKKLVALKKDVATGIYVKRKYPHELTIYDFVPSGKVRNLTVIPDKPFRVDACGAGFLLISNKVLQAYTKEIALRPGLLEDKWFGQPFHHITFMNDGQPEQLAEDISFCHRMKALGFEIWAEPSIKLGHVGRMTFQREHFEAVHNQVLQSDKRNDGNPDGWMTEQELEWLKQAAAQCESVVEVGSWKGRSTKALLEGCKGTVTAVDHFEGSDDYGDHTFTIGRAEPVYDIFMRNVGHYTNLIVMRMSSEEAASSLNGDRADMVFIDSDHRYSQVKAEIDRWLPKTKKVICGHDYGDGWPGVKKAVEEKFEKFYVCGSIWYAEVSGKE